MGLTDNGFVRRTYDDILNAKIQRAKELFGEDIDTSDLTPLGKFIRINAYDQALAEEELEAVYYARFPNTATGQSLDRLLVFGGLTRNPAVSAVYSVKITGAADTVIEPGFLVGTETGIQYYTTEEATIGAGGTVTVNAACTEAGVIGNVSAPAINLIVNPDANITAVAGVERVSAGTDTESDAALRKRLQAAYAGASSSNADAIRAALLRIPTVLFAAVVVNDGDKADADERPPHSFECYILGGEDYEDEIGQTIFDKRPIGIKTVGDKAVTVTDASGNAQTVHFSYSPHVQIHVKAQIKTSSAYPSDGAGRIYSAVAGYIDGLGIGTSLVLSTLYGQIYSVPGVTEVTSLTASTNGGTTYSASNVTVPAYGVAVCAAVDVEVVTT